VAGLLLNGVGEKGKGGEECDASSFSPISSSSDYLGLGSHDWAALTHLLAQMYRSYFYIFRFADSLSIIWTAGCDFCSGSFIRER